TSILSTTCAIFIAAAGPQKAASARPQPSQDCRQGAYSKKINAQGSVFGQSPTFLEPTEGTIYQSKEWLFQTAVSGRSCLYQEPSGRQPQPSRRAGKTSSQMRETG